MLICLNMNQKHGEKRRIFFNKMFMLILNNKIDNFESIY